MAISDDLLNQLYVRWHAKIFSLKEFYGDTAFANVEFSSIEMVLLRQLSADLATLPLFDFNSGEELEVRSAEFERSWPTPEFQREHAKTVQALTQWLEGELARCPDSVKRRYIMAVRSGYLIDAIEGFLTEDRGLVGKASSARTQFHVAIFKALTNLRTKGILADPMIENANPSTALEQLVGRYLRVAFAQPGHPFYASLDAEGELDPFYQRYKEYLKSGASLEEKALLDQIDAIYMTPDKSLIPPNDGSVKKDK